MDVWEVFFILILDFRELDEMIIFELYDGSSVV